MKKIRRNFLKTAISYIFLLPFLKIDNFFFYNKRKKIKKNNNFVWHLNSDD
tara:strand:+ start:2031 stop:2183 length:153 start_codon:yes stop_codon:yes gene_type:complete